jgi:hypothetical protein
LKQAERPGDEPEIQTDASHPFDFRSLTDGFLSGKFPLFSEIQQRHRVVACNALLVKRLWHFLIRESGWSTFVRSLNFSRDCAGKTGYFDENIPACQ